MFTLLFLLPFLTALIIPFTKKEIKFQNNLVVDEGCNANICLVKIRDNEFAIKTPKYNKFEVTEIACLLFTSSLSTPFVIRLKLVSLSNDGYTLGMPKMLGNAFSLYPPSFGYLPNEQLIAKVKEQTLIDIITGIAELRKIGIAHNDLARGNVLFDTFGNVNIADFGISDFIPLETDERIKTSNEKNSIEDYSKFRQHFLGFLNFFKGNGIKFENNWNEIFALINEKNKLGRTYAWIVDRIRENAFK